MNDIVVVAMMIGGFAILATVHVTIVIGLLRRTTKTRALIGFLLAPTAPYFAWKEHMRVRAVLWIVAFVLYVLSRILGLRGA